MSQFEKVEEVSLPKSSPIAKFAIGLIAIIVILWIWSLISSWTKEPQIIKDTKQLNQINLEDAHDLLAKREAEARIHKRSEIKAKLLERIDFNWK